MTTTELITKYSEIRRIIMELQDIGCFVTRLIANGNGPVLWLISIDDWDHGGNYSRLQSRNDLYESMRAIATYGNPIPYNASLFKETVFPNEDVRINQLGTDQSVIYFRRDVAMLSMMGAT